jgi:hypothetical protein
MTAPVEKACRHCSESKPITEFYPSKVNRDGYRNECKSCQSIRAKANKLAINNTVNVTEKLCPYCKTVKPFSEFGRHKRTAIGLQVHCRACRKEYRNTHRISLNYPVSVTEKYCTRCGQTKPSSSFTKAKRYKDGLSTYCTNCKLKSDSAYKRTLKGYLTFKIQTSRREAKKDGREFSITLNDLLELWNSQGGKCYYTGRDMEHYSSGNARTKNPSAVTIDRLDSSRGYTRDNIALCVWVVNRAKNALSVREFVGMCQEVSNRFLGEDK